MLICAISVILCRPNRNLQDTGTSLKTYNDSVSIVFGWLSWVNSTFHEIYCSFVLFQIELIPCYLQFPTTSLPVNPPHPCFSSDIWSINIFHVSNWSKGFKKIKCNNTKGSSKFTFKNNSFSWLKITHSFSALFAFAY